jgi:hypothetical protein
MPYCHKCGAKLEEDAKFCHKCGTPVGVPAAATPARRVRTPIYVPVVVLVAVLVVGMFAVLAFMPMRSVSFAEAREVPFETGVTDLSLDFDADTAQVNINFENLTEKLVTLNVSVTGAVGILAPSDLLNVTFDHTSIGNQLRVTSGVHTVHGWPWTIWLKVTCDLRIDPSMSMNLTVLTSTGKIAMNTEAGVVFNGLILKTTTGEVEANLGPNVVVNDTIVLRTTTGGVDFSWNNANATTNALVDVKTTTGGIDINIAQINPLSANITMNAEATTGGITFAIAIQDSVAAKIESSNTLGGISADKVGFTGTNSQIQSSNHPASSNFSVNLKNTTGHIHINATYTP